MPKQPASKSKGSSTVVVLTIIAGFALGFIVRGQMTAPSSGSADAYQRGFDDAKARVMAAGLIPLAVPMYELHGTVTATGADWIEIEVPQMVSNPFENPAPTVRRVRVTDGTKLLTLKQKSDTEFQKEVAAYEAAMAKDGVPQGAAPTLVTELPTEISAIAKNATVVAKAASDVRLADSFDAVEVRISPPAPGAPEMPSARP